MLTHSGSADAATDRKRVNGIALAFAGSRTALNGTWVLEPTQSDFQGELAIQTGTVTINEREGDITVSRDFKYEGADKTFFYRDMADSENGATIHSGKDLKVVTTKSRVATTESYMLAINGTMTVSVAKPGTKTITLVFTRK